MWVHAMNSSYTCTYVSIARCFVVVFEMEVPAAAPVAEGTRRRNSIMCRMAEIYGKETQGSTLAWRAASLLLRRLILY